ncbi:MAG: DMSO reductase [Gallionellales bacterium 35-53-114]|jgi:DMSO reductase anchor subunit|nr:MAG: DMSO reductase [Gallionellales bacterium 35-53-114]OYZ64005.1 MAG: DMSO reductase [Gallionellales bacterium 24-53-125]OZB09166.1 MAG: DMSO reductase [Gallionellales bacterium 39-52-133]HQS59239.1 dimethyl sulfoxide reductase anchor subunit [Gallionellaceae bacterium]HQS75975.1 dimethyl sulfoxide reductase anchor subunit [Gallionellaceae bacterium]
MKPPFSVIFLTTLIGVGQGLFLALYTGQLYSFFDLLPAQDSRSFYATGSIIALVFLGAGLFASFFHLGHPERAWRSAAMWRTSWLSREVIVLPAFIGTVFLYGVAHWFNFNAPMIELSGSHQVDITLILGAAGTFLSFALFISTGMIYACLRFMQEWHTPLTPINFTLFGGASGFLLASVFAAMAAPQLTGFYAGWAIILTALAFISRSASLWRNSRIKPKSSLSTAIGIKHPNIVQISQGSMGGSFNTRAFFHGKSAAFIRTIKPGFIVLTFILPLILLVPGLSSPKLLVAAFVIQYAGLLAERWFFFAEANHPQNLYYQKVA